jgi:hypothetical protein
MNGTFSVKNFAKFQHYKKRSPPWIKVYNVLLDDYEFGRLPDASKLHLIAIWLLASRYQNAIPYDPEWIAHRINATERINLAVLESAGFIVLDQDCSKMLAERKQSAPLETERETEREIDISLTSFAHPSGDGNGSEKSTSPRKNKTPAPYPEAFEALWSEYRPIGIKTASKRAAFISWNKLSTEDQDVCWLGLVRYVGWLIDERSRRPDHPVKHLVTFINQRCWEPFMELEEEVFSEQSQTVGSH